MNQHKRSCHGALARDVIVSATVVGLFSNIKKYKISLYLEIKEIYKNVILIALTRISSLCYKYIVLLSNGYWA